MGSRKDRLLAGCDGFKRVAMGGGVVGFLCGRGFVLWGGWDGMSK